MGYVWVILASYMIGCSNMALYISKIKNVDIRTGGSGNLGASNATALLGWRAGILVALHDIGKAALVVYLAKRFFPEIEETAPVPTSSPSSKATSITESGFPANLRIKSAS